MSDPNIEKIKEVNMEELKRGDIKRTVMQIKDYLFNVVSDTKQLEDEIRKEIEKLEEEF